MYQLIKILAKIIKKEKLIKGKDSFLKKINQKQNFRSKTKFLGLEQFIKKYICT